MNPSMFLFKSGLSGLGAVIAHYTNNISTLFWLLIFFEAADYITGIISAVLNDGVSSTEAVRGAVKKLGLFVLVGVGYGIDYIVVVAKDIVGLDVNYPPCVFGMLTLCYLLSTEGISILENLSEIGVEVPFLNRTLALLRDKANKKGDKVNEDNKTKHPE